MAAVYSQQSQLILKSSICLRKAKSLTHRLVSTQSRLSNSASLQETAVLSPAPPLDFTNLPPVDLSKARLIPASSSYFTGAPVSTDKYLEVQALLRKYQTLPTVAPSDAPRIAWRSVEQYRTIVGEPVRTAKYQQVLALLHRLNRIHPSLKPPEIDAILHLYKRDVDPSGVTRKPAVIDEDGKTFAIGRRKTSQAKVFLVQGEGNVLINGVSLTHAFKRVHDRESALWALKATQRLDKYNVWALVKGGGTTGQAEAIALGAAKALMVFEPDLKPALRRAGCLTRDARRVERKKPGHLKARKKPAWVKR